MLEMVHDVIAKRANDLMIELKGGEDNGGN